MPAKKKSDLQRLIEFGFDASEEQLNLALETLAAIKAKKFPRQARKPATGRKASAKQARSATVQADLLTTEPPEDQDEKPARRSRRTNKAEQEKFTPDPYVMQVIEDSKHERAAAASGD